MTREKVSSELLKVKEQIAKLKQKEKQLQDRKREMDDMEILKVTKKIGITPEQLKLLNNLSEKEINENTKYYRVASVNSPFREQIVWAHMINSCRPGMPERNMDEWAEGIFRQ